MRKKQTHKIIDVLTIHGHTVLIVEDDGILAVQLRNLLVGLGYSVPEPAAGAAPAC